MPRQLKGCKAAFLATDGVEQVDLLSGGIDERRLDKMVEQSFPASDPLPGPIALG